MTESFFTKIQGKFKLGFIKVRDELRQARDLAIILGLHYELAGLSILLLIIYIASRSV